MTTTMVESPGEVVVASDLSFRVAGVACPIQFRPHLVDVDTVVVVIDAIRCSSTLVGVAAAGAAGIIVRPKVSTGANDDLDTVVVDGVPVEVIHAGELHGRPFPRARFGNSIVGLPTTEIAGRVVCFASTNFGAMWEKVVGSVEGQQPTVVVATFANVDAVVAELAGHTGRIVLCLGGFYNRSSIEDHIVAGRILQGLRLGDDELDDDARLMLMAAEHHHDDERMITALEGNRIGRALATFDRAGDIRANILGTGVEPDLWAAMRRTVPVMAWSEDLAILRHTASGNA